MRVNKLFALIVFFTIGLSALSQKEIITNYSPLQASGEVPKVFRELSVARYNKEVDSLFGAEKGKAIEQKKDFYLKSNFSLSEILTSGKVLYGDPLTSYIKDIAKELLKHDKGLYNKLQFYTLKSPIPNASSTAHGVIFFNVGLLAKLNNEAEIAFVLAHEISHFLSEDQVNSYINKIELIEGKKGSKANRWMIK